MVKKYRSFSFKNGGLRSNVIPAGISDKFIRDATAETDVNQ
jgi:hypothetical protein